MVVLKIGEEKRENKAKKFLKKYKKIIAFSSLFLFFSSFQKDFHKNVFKKIEIENDEYQDINDGYLVNRLERIIKSDKFGDEEKAFLMKIFDLPKRERNDALKMLEFILYHKDYKKGLIKDIAAILDEARREDKSSFRTIYEDISDMLLNRNFSFEWISKENLETLVKIKALIEEYEKEEMKKNTYNSLGKVIFWIKDFKQLESLHFLLNFKKPPFLYLVNAYKEWIKRDYGNITENKNLNKAMDYLKKHKKPFYLLLDYTYAFSFLNESYIELINSKFNVDFFLRYEKDLLLYQLEAATSSLLENKLLAIAVLQKEDYNGVLYKFSKNLRKLVNKYKILFYEVSNEEEFYKTLKNVYEEFGKINVLIIAGHGDERGTAFSYKESEKETLDISDEKEIEKLKGFFDEKSSIIMFSCSTGKGNENIASLLSRTLEVTVFAPSENISNVDFIFDERGEIKWVKFDGKIVKGINNKKQNHIEEEKPEYEK